MKKLAVENLVGFSTPKTLILYCMQWNSGFIYSQWNSGLIGRQWSAGLRVQVLTLWLHLRVDENSGFSLSAMILCYQIETLREFLTHATSPGLPRVFLHLNYRLFCDQKTLYRRQVRGSGLYSVILISFQRLSYQTEWWLYCTTRRVGAGLSSGWIGNI